MALLFITLLTWVLQCEPDSLGRLTLPAYYSKIPEVTFEQTELPDVIRHLSRVSKTSLFLDPGVQGTVSFRFFDQSVCEIVSFLGDRYGFQPEINGTIVRLKPIVEVVKKPWPEPVILFDGKKLTLDVRNYPLDSLLRNLTIQTGLHPEAESGLPEFVTGFISVLDPNEAIPLFFRKNGMLAEISGQRIKLRRLYAEPEGTGSGSAFWLAVRDSTISLDVKDTPVSRILQEAIRQTNRSVIFYGSPEGRLSIRVSNISFDQFLDLSLKSTNYSFRKEGSVYLIGERNSPALESSRLIPLKNRKVEAIQDLIPSELQQQANIRIIRDQNAILVTSTLNVISNVEQIIHAIDFPTPQVLIEALVVDFSKSDGISTGISAGTKGSDSSKVSIGNSSTVAPGLDFTLDGRTLNNWTKTWGTVNVFGTDINMARVGRLPDDFYLRVQALEKAGLATVRSRPMLSTLNGHKATLQVGTTQYYILKSTTPLRDSQGVIVTETQQFKEIAANITLEITPWVSASGEVTVEIKPVFETPVGQFSPDIPPTINKRSFESTVRLADGETIVLGGLIEESDQEISEGWPWISRIPFIGNFFSNKSTIRKKSELIIYVTPKIYYGSTATERMESQ